jgi:phytoene dehydrogenase-like protein
MLRIVALAGCAAALAPPALSIRSATRLQSTAENVAQTQETSRDKVMTFSYDTERERKYAKPVYKGTGDGLGGEEGEYDVVVIGSGMGGLACGAMCAKYGESSIVLESHIKMGGSAHSFTHGHEGGKYSFEVGPSIFEGLDKPSLNPLRILLDILDSELPVETYQGLAYWVPTSNFDGTGPVRSWRFQLGDPEAPGGFYEALREHAQDGELAIKEFKALRARLKTLGGSTSAVSLLNLRQDAGFLATTAGSLPFVLSHPDVFADLPLTFDSLHKTVDQLVTEPFLRNFIDTMCIFCGLAPASETRPSHATRRRRDARTNAPSTRQPRAGFPAKGAMTAHMLYILERFFEPGCAYSVPKGGTENIARAIHRGGP